MQQTAQFQQLLYPTKVTAKLMGRSEYSVRMLYYAGELPAVREGRKLWFHIDDITEFIARNKRKA